MLRLEVLVGTGNAVIGSWRKGSPIVLLRSARRLTVVRHFCDLEHGRGRLQRRDTGARKHTADDHRLTQCTVSLLTRCKYTREMRREDTE